MTKPAIERVFYCPEFMTIRNALMTLVSGAGFAVPVSYPGVNFTPPNEGTWLEVRLFENRPTDTAIANDGTTTETGLLQISACTRNGSGVVQADTLAREVQAAFPKGTKIQGSVRVTQHPYRMGDVVEDDRIKIPVTIPYSS